MNFRIAAVGVVQKPALHKLAVGQPRVDAHVGNREVYFDGGYLETPVYLRDRLGLVQVVAGPAIIEESGLDDGVATRVAREGPRPRRADA